MGTLWCARQLREGKGRKCFLRRRTGETCFPQERKGEACFLRERKGELMLSTREKGRNLLSTRQKGRTCFLRERQPAEHGARHTAHGARRPPPKKNKTKPNSPKRPE